MECESLKQSFLKGFSAAQTHVCLWLFMFLLHIFFSRLCSPQTWTSGFLFVPVQSPSGRNVKLTKCFSSSQREYPKSLSQCLQERGLSVEMLYLQAESGLTRALQDVRADGSPLCILVEQKNIALSSCTVIIFSESLKSKSVPLVLLLTCQNCLTPFTI